MAATDPRSNVELEQILRTHTGVVAALAQGASLAARTAGVGLPLAVLYAVGSGFLGELAMDAATGLLDAPEATVQTVAQVAMAVGGFCTLYAILQFPKRERASRVSWIPALFAIPALLVGIAGLLLQGGQGRQLGPALLQFVTTATDLVWDAFAGSAVVIGWLVAGKSVLDGGKADPVAAFERIRARTLDVAAVHGGKGQAVSIGLQLLLPGIFYALQLAFADMVVVLDPEKPAMKRSSQLTLNMRGRLFRILVVWFLAWSGMALAVVAFDSGAKTGSDFGAAVVKVAFDPSVVRGPALYVSEVLATVLWWVHTMAMLALYVEREGQVKAKNELRAREKAARAEAPVGELPPAAGGA